MAQPQHTELQQKILDFVNVHFEPTTAQIAGVIYPRDSVKSGSDKVSKILRKLEETGHITRHLNDRGASTWKTAVPNPTAEPTAHAITPAPTEPPIAAAVDIETTATPQQPPETQAECGHDGLFSTAKEKAIPHLRKNGILNQTDALIAADILIWLCQQNKFCTHYEIHDAMLQRGIIKNNPEHGIMYILYLLNQMELQNVIDIQTEGQNTTYSYRRTSTNKTPEFNAEEHTPAVLETLTQPKPYRITHKHLSVSNGTESFMLTVTPTGVEIEDIDGNLLFKTLEQIESFADILKTALAEAA